MAGQLELSRVSFMAKSLIAIEGKQNFDRFFIISRGQVRLFREAMFVPEDRGRIRGPGDFFAVVSALSGHSCIETAQALTAVDLIAVRRDQYGEFIQQFPPAAMKILMEFSGRLRRLDEALSRLALKKSVEIDVSHLFKVGEFYNRHQQFSQARYAYEKYLKYCPGGEHTAAARERLARIAPGPKAAIPEWEAGEFSRTYPAGSLFFAEGEPGEELYILQRGSVKISKIVDDHEVLIAVLRGGDIFGEMAMLERKPRAASAAAHEDCMVTAVNRGNFERMIREQPQIVARLTALQAERIWFIYRQLANALVEDPLGRMFDTLRIHLERHRIDPLSTASHVFNFGPRELAGMAGLSPEESGAAVKKLMENEHIRLIKDQIFVLNVSEIYRQASFFKTRQKLDKARRPGSGF